MAFTTHGRCGCGAKYEGPYSAWHAWRRDHNCTLPQQEEQPFTDTALMEADEDAAYFDAERDAILDAYDGSK